MLPCPSKADGIGTDHAFLFAFVAQYHHAVVVPAFVKSECAEVHPCAASYLLVHLELRDASIVEYKIFGIAYAARQCLVRYVYSIFSRFRNIGTHSAKALSFFFSVLAKRAVPERKGFSLS